MTTKIIEIQNPIHDGFYGGSILNPGEEGSGVEESAYYNDNQELGGYLDDNNMSIEYNYKEYETAITSAVNDLFIEIAEEILSDDYDIEDLFIKKESEELVSPRYYNFETDKSFIKIEVDADKYKQFIDKVFKDNYDSLKEYIHKRHSSYDGFYSFYSNDIDEWIAKKDDLDHNELETIFKFIIGNDDQHDITDSLYELVSETFYNTGFWYEKDGEKHYFSDLLEMLEKKEKVEKEQQRLV